MKKRSIAARLGVAAMALTLVTTSLSSGTLAKYTSTYYGATTLKIAGWQTAADFSYKDQTTGAETSKAMTAVESDFAAVDLANTAYGASEAAGVKDGQVVTGVIAPGMGGEFKLDVYGAGKDAGLNSTEVDVIYKVFIKRDKTSANTGHFVMWEDGKNKETEAIKFGTGTTEGEADYDPTYTGSQNTGWLLAEGRINAGASKTTTAHVVKKIKWEWPYTADGTVENTVNDEEDNKAGVDGIGTANDVKYTIRIEFTQANPTTARPTA